MKNLKLAFAPAFLIAIMLSACSTVPAQNEATDKTLKQTVGEQVLTTEQAILQPVNELEEVVPMPEIQSRFGEKMSCDMLADENERKNCAASVNDLIGMALEREIMDSFDISRCGLFPEQTAVSCRRMIEESGVKGPISVADRQALNAALQPIFPEPALDDEGIPLEIVVEATVPRYDASRCKGLQAEGLRAYCEKNVLERFEQQKLSEIVSSGNLNSCDALSSASLKEQCRIMLGEMPVEMLSITDVPVQPTVELPSMQAVVPLE